MLGVPTLRRPEPAPDGSTTGHCTFCSQLVNGERRTLDWAVISESRDFVAVPSLGALVPGWILLVPKRHILNLARLDPQQQSALRVEALRLKSSIEPIFGPVTMFEHGPSQAGSRVGCGVDHAHMHLVPAGGLDLLVLAQASYPDLPWYLSAGLDTARRANAAGLPYLLIEAPDGSSVVAASPEIPSQAVRRLIAAEQGRPDQFDWAQFPQLEAVQETLNRLSVT